VICPEIELQPLQKALAAVPAVPATPLSFIIPIMSPITELKHLFTGSPSAGDRRWASYPPLRPLRGIIVLALLLIIIQASGWISFTVAARGHYYEYLDFTRFSPTLP
jgi:hypothetical protein